MAILFLCAMQPERSGWRSQVEQNVVEAVGTVAEVSPRESSPLQQGAEALLDEAGRILEAGVSEAESLLGRTNDGAHEQVRQPLPGPRAEEIRGTAAPSGWPEIERALEDPVGRPRGAAPSNQPTLRERMRRPEASAEIPRWSGEASVGRGLQAPSAEVGPHWPGPRAQGPEDDPALRVSQAIDRTGLDRSTSFDRQLPDDLESQANVPDGGREVIYEAEPQGAPIGRQRYLSPPARENALVDRPLAADEVRSANSMHRAGAGQGEGRLFDLPDPPAELSRSQSAAAQAQEVAETSVQAGPAAAARPWGPLLLSVLALFGSLGLNVYLGWIAWDLYSRHQDAVDDIHELEAKLETKQQDFATSTGPRMVARGSLVR